MTPDLIHAGAVIAFGGFAGCVWAGVRHILSSAWWAAAAMVFLLGCVIMAIWQVH